MDDRSGDKQAYILGPPMKKAASENAFLLLKSFLKGLVRTMNQSPFLCSITGRIVTLDTYLSFRLKGFLQREEP